MDEALDHLNQVSVFGRSALALALILGVDFAISALHAFQEWKGKGAPLWRNFGAIVGVQVPDWLGFSGFTVFLTLALWALGLVGIVGWVPLVGPMSVSCAAGALGALIGARLSDTLVSHVLLYCLGYRPNPGLSSTPLYILEALFLAFAFHAGLAAHAKSAAIGAVVAAAFFVLVLPLLRGLRWAMPGWQREAWSRWQPLPSWAAANPTAL